MEAFVLADISKLIETAQSGDRDSFSQLVELYQNRVYGLAFHLTGNSEDAKDLAQETFIKAYHYLETFRFQSEFGTWLHRIAVNTWINIKRKDKNHKFLSLDEAYTDNQSSYVREIASTEDDPSTSIENLEFESLVRKCLLELTDEHRTVLVLREIYGYSYEEIAASTDASIGTVKSRINRAKTNLRQKIEELARKYDYLIPYGDRR